MLTFVMKNINNFNQTRVQNDHRAFKLYTDMQNCMLRSVQSHTDFALRFHQLFAFSAATAILSIRRSFFKPEMSNRITMDA